MAPPAFNTAVPPKQILGLFTVTFGLAITVTATVLVLEQPVTVLVPVTVYIVVTVGDTVILEVVAPVLQLYVFAPVAERLTGNPEQTVALLTATVGDTAILTLTVLVLEHPDVVPVTV